MATTVFIPDETQSKLMDIKHELEKQDNRDYSWHRVIDKLIEFYRNNHNH